MEAATTSSQPISARDTRPSLDVTAHRVACGVGGVWHLGDWISAEEEAALTNRIYSEHSQDWTKLRDRRLLHLGGSPCDALGQGIDREPLPSWAQAVCDELVHSGLHRIPRSRWHVHRMLVHAFDRVHCGSGEPAPH